MGNPGGGGGLLPVGDGCGGPPPPAKTFIAPNKKAIKLNNMFGVIFMVLKIQIICLKKIFYLIIKKSVCKK